MEKWTGHALYERYKACNGLTTDSRDCAEGSLFFALKGANFDGNRYAANALAQGCRYAVVDDEKVVPEGDERYLLVDDVLTALQQVAREHRRKHDIPVIGITGTNGKTTTKELVRQVLAKKYRVLATEGNFNNDIGVPKTLLRLTEEDEVAVVEMGASHPGDIRRLVETAEPTCGLITNVGRAHLQGFGSLEGVCRTKGELYDYLKGRNGAVVFLNADDERLVSMAEARGLTHCVRYGQKEGTAVEVEGQWQACDPMLRFRWRIVGNHTGPDGNEWHEVATHLIGAYNMNNMLAAAAVGFHFGVAPEKIDEALAAYEPKNNRSQLTLTEHNRLVVDAYNANPSSMAVAIENFRLMAVAPKMAILGDMRELGDVSAEEHQRVVDQLAQAGLEDVWLVGEEFGKTRCAYRKFADVEAVKQALAAEKPQGRYILVKGSNGMRLFELPALL